MKRNLPTSASPPSISSTTKMSVAACSWPNADALAAADAVASGDAVASADAVVVAAAEAVDAEPADAALGVAAVALVG
jgi:hypothetical protein